MKVFCSFWKFLSAVHHVGGKDSLRSIGISLEYNGKSMNINLLILLVLNSSQILRNIIAITWILVLLLVLSRFILSLGSTGDTKTPSNSTSSSAGNSLQKKSILVGRRPGLGVSSMLSQFKNYSQSKKNVVLSQRPSVFCSPDDEDEEEEVDYSRFLEMKGNSRPVLFSVSLNRSMVWIFHCFFQLPCDWIVNVLIAFLKSLPQRIQTPNSLSTRWPLLWQKGDPSWREKPRRTTKTILFSRKS